MSQPNSAQNAPVLREVLRAPSVTLYLVASFCISAGTFMQAAALGKQVYDITGRELDIGIVGLLEFAPAALLVLVAGYVADRFNRRTVAMFALSAEILCAGALFLYGRHEQTSVVPIFFIAFGFGVARAFMAPATRAIPPLLAPENGLPRVVALHSATWNFALIFGPALSGIFYSIGSQWPYFAAMLIMGLALFLLGSVQFRRAQDQSVAEERPSIAKAMEGLRFIRRTPILFAAISLDLFAVLFGGAIALLPVIAEERLGVGDVAYGWLRASAGIGALMMGLILIVLPVKRNVGRTLHIAVAVFGIATIVLGVTRSYAVAFLAVIVLSAADMVSVFIRASLVPLVTPDEARGRVNAVENVFIGASNELGAFESGAVSQAAGVPFTVIGGGVATIAVVGVFWFAFPVLRRINRFEDIETQV
jgi:MFS family permease